MRTVKKYLVVIVALGMFSSAWSQKIDPADAKEHFKFGNYIDAYELYQQLVIQKPNNAEYTYKAGLSLLFTNANQFDAIKYLEKAVELDAGVDALFYLAKAYHSNLKLEKALNAFINYKNADKGTKQEEVDRQIEYVKHAIKLVENPINVSFENLGDKINSEFPDYSPYITPDESFIVYTSRRKSKVREFDGYYPSSIYYSHVVSGEFLKSRKGNQSINTIYDDQAVGLSPNADKLYIYLDDMKNTGDIYEAFMKDYKFKKKVKMSKPVNSKGFESSATVSTDGNTLFFSSYRKGGYGGKDLYMTRKLPDGKWAEPQNLGNTVNTEHDEDFPNLFYDGTTLYFSSKGHNSMGGYDYFKSSWDPTNNTWSKPENLGYPLNTTRDNLCISFTQDEMHAYISAWRKDSKGFQDIYKVTFNPSKLKETIIKAQIKTNTTNEVIKDAFIIVTNNETEEERNYIPNSNTGNVIISLPQGSYTIIIDAEGYNFTPENIKIADKSDFVPLITKTFIVTP